MKFLSKVTFSLGLVSIFLLACVFVLIASVTGIWLQSYRPIVNKTPVATFTISALKEDSGGKYIDVEVQPYINDSALQYLFNPRSIGTTVGDIQKFKLYGDSVHIGGPVLRFWEGLMLFNYQGVYKLSSIYGRYNFSGTPDQAKTITSSYDLNGGIDPIWNIVLTGSNSWPLSMFIQETKLSIPAPIPPSSQPDETRKYNLFVTPGGFVSERVN